MKLPNRGAVRMEPISEDLIAGELDALSKTEFLVYQVLINRNARSHDVGKIAKLCSLTDLQVIVAIQLLVYKGVLPTEEILQ
jgi:hypothetical protein